VNGCVLRRISQGTEKAEAEKAKKDVLTANGANRRGEEGTCHSEEQSDEESLFAAILRLNEILPSRYAGLA